MTIRNNRNISDILPLIPAPPHDPTWWLLNNLVGWRSSFLGANIDVSKPSGALVLSQPPKSGREFTEDNGSMGGLLPPSNVGVTPSGTIILLDRSTNILKVFDPCICAFAPLAVFAKKEATRGGCQDHVISSECKEPEWALDDPHGITVHDDDLYICDTGNRRVIVMSLASFTVRSVWTLPARAEVNKKWKPYALAFDSGHRAYVTDQANRCIHVFDRHGLWLRFIEVSGPATHIGIDTEDNILVVVEGTPPKFIKIDRAGEGLPAPSRPAEISYMFPVLPFKSDTGGNLDLQTLCSHGSIKKAEGEHCTEDQCFFDMSGNAIPEMVPAPAERYERQGRFISTALDSGLYQCQWHRIVLRGTLPEGTSVKVYTYTAETEHPHEFILGISRRRWETAISANFMQNGEWDCLVQGGKGRYLWLRLDFSSTGEDSPWIEEIQVEYPRISLRRYLPGVFGVEPVSADFTDRFLGIFDMTYREIERKIDLQAHYFDPLSAPSDRPVDGRPDFLSWLASWTGVKLDRHWPKEKQRNYLKNAGKLLGIRGTRRGLWEQLVIYLGMDRDVSLFCGDTGRKSCCREKPSCERPSSFVEQWDPPPLILEHYQLRRWLFFGAGLLGDQAALWGRRIVNRSMLNNNARNDVSQLKTSQDPHRDPFHVYAHQFSVFVPSRFKSSETDRRALESLLEREKPGHTQYQLEFVEPRFRIGYQSTIGFDSVVGRYPEGINLDKNALTRTPLGKSTVLGSSMEREDGPSMKIGRRSSIGTTTALK